MSMIGRVVVACGLWLAAATACAQTQHETLRWLRDVRVTQNAVADEPIFIEGVSHSCERSPEYSRPPVVQFLSASQLRVTITLQRAIDCIGSGGTRPWAFQIGPLPAGQYTIEVHGVAPAIDTVFVLPDTIRLSVVDRPFAIGAYHAGIWSDPDQPGEGVVIEVTEQGTIFAFFGKNTDGRPLWLVSEVDPYATRAPPKLYEYPEGTFQAPSPTAVEWGVVYLSAGFPLYCDELRVQMIRKDGVQKFMELQKLVTSRSHPRCRARPPEPGT